MRTLLYKENLESQQTHAPEKKCFNTESESKTSKRLFLHCPRAESDGALPWSGTTFIADALLVLCDVLCRDMVVCKDQRREACSLHWQDEWPAV